MNEGNQRGQDQTRQKPEEFVERRGSAKGNTAQAPTTGTQSPGAVSRGLIGVREAARRDKTLQCTALLHHLTPECLRGSFARLKRNASPGVDGVRWEDYAPIAEKRVADLHRSVQEGSYRAQPVKRARILKEDGSERLLGVSALEDKVVQGALVEVLNAIYEVDFKGFSYGFRPGRSQHDALDALWVGLTSQPVNWVLDMDIQGFFDHIQHDWLMRFLGHRIGDKRILRLIKKWLRVGAFDEGQWLDLAEGSPQGAAISPLLANIYLHYAFDLWADWWRRHHARGRVVIVRYAYDTVMGFQGRDDAEAFRTAVAQRLNRFGLTLHPEKTRLLEFGRYATINRKQRGEGKPETFDFLGMTHICSCTRRGKYTIRRQTTAKRLRAKLQQVKRQLRRRLHRPVPETARWLRAVLQGYYNYHAVPYNLASLRAFWHHLSRAWFKALRRRSQKARGLTWERFKRFRDAWLPLPRILHPWPSERFRRRHPRQEPYAVIPHVRICAGGAS